MHEPASQPDDAVQSCRPFPLHSEDLPLHLFLLVLHIFSGESGSLGDAVRLHLLPAVLHQGKSLPRQHGHGPQAPALLHSLQ